jgi:serine/threonine protein kinase
MLRTRQKLGKYRIEGRLSDGQYASIYKAYDTIQGIRVALKVPHEDAMDEFFLQDFRREARLAPRLEHENVLPIRDASFIDGRFVIVMPLGVQSLADRQRRRMSTQTALDFTEQALAAVARAHEVKIIHCDIKPENFIIFPEGRLKLTDFGFSKIAQRKMLASGSGTVGYIAPEQAVGRPMFQSDVFSLGLMIYELFSGHLPSWPYAWPPANVKRVRAKLGPGLVGWLRKAIEVNPEQRYKNAVSMYREFRRLRNGAVAKNRRARRQTSDDPLSVTDVLFRQFRRKYRKVLPTPHECHACTGPISQEMIGCPWCGVKLRAKTLAKDFPAACPRCGRGSKLDWPFCAWCYGRSFEVETNRHYPDKRYVARCSHADCRGELMPFMRYCPWCRRKVARPWRLEKSRDRCPSCRWGVDLDYWHYCPWCSVSLGT